jgi:hypothetical protein
VLAISMAFENQGTLALDAATCPQERTGTRARAKAREADWRRQLARAFV